MFSDRHRPLKATLLVILILLLCFYSHSMGQAEITAKDYVRNPGKYDNTSLFIKRDGRVLETGNGYFDVFIDGEEFRVYDEIPGIQEGDMVTGEFIFHSNRSLDIVQMHIHKYRDIKLILSIVAAAVVLLLLWKIYRFNTSKMVLEER